jgi:large subunit ribosomal protein L3
MIPTIKGVKLGMTAVFDATGTTTAVTLVRPYRAVVTQVKTPVRDGYSAVQLAYREAAPKHVNKPMRGVLDHAGTKDSFTKFYEVKVPEADLPKYHPGDEVNPADFLIAWAEVDVIGTSKGKGFAGVVKRYHFAGQCRTHGDPDNRRPQSNGGTDAARVFKGSRRPGHMGDERVSLHACSIYEYFRKLNVIVIQGSVPGPIGAELTLRLSKEFSPEEQTEHEKMITLDEHQLGLIDEQEHMHPHTKHAHVEKPVVEAEPVVEAAAEAVTEPEVAEAAADVAEAPAPAEGEGN